MLPPETQVEEEEQEDLGNLEELLSVRCVRCGRKINILNALFDENESPVCGGC